MATNTVQNTVQYSDGRTEIINVPKAFSVGDVVSVTHRRDGGVVVQRVGSNIPPSGLFSMTSQMALGDYLLNLRIRATIKKYSSGYSDATISMIFYGYDSDPTYTSVLKSASELVLNTNTIIETSDILMYSNKNTRVTFDISAGCYVIIDNVQYSTDSGSTWFYYTDGNFANGEFKTSAFEGWVKSTENNFTAVMIDETCKTQNLV